MYENGKMRLFETVLGMQRREIKENDEGMNLTMIYC
jgi:hypothetical protein